MTHAPDDYALVIGINDYPRWNNGAKSLKGSVKDAQDFHEWLVADAGGGLSRNNVKLILSSGAPLAPRQFAIDDAFREIREQSEGKTRRRFYFYFSGHGHSRAGSWQQQSLCLANWSPVDAGAALHLESYIKASIGCLKFAEAVFFLDCCRVRAIVPLGQQSELECGDPDAKNRYSAVLFGSDQYEPTYEGEVEEEIRGYFTSGLLKVLKEGTIELGDLLKRLKVIVPELAKPKDQTVRAIPADTEIYLGPPGSRPPAPNYATDDGTHVKISVISNLIGRNSKEDDSPPPLVGDISVLRDDLLIRRGLGSLTTKLPPGRYQVRIDHAEASVTHDLDVAGRRVNRDFVLPRRASATLLSSTVDKHEWLTDPVVKASKWDASKGGQAIFVSLRSRQPAGSPEILGSLDLEDPFNRRRKLYDAHSLHHVPLGMARLVYHDRRGTASFLPIPIAKDWDTHVFVLVSEGKPSLETASVSMRPAGAGFDPSDALIDAYERAIGDLVTGGPGPDPATLDALLWGKYRNPLFGLLGAHFLIRDLRRHAVPDPYLLERLSIVADNLGNLLGVTAPDVVALRLWKQLILNQQPSERPTHDLPLFNVGFQAFIEATAQSDSAPLHWFDDVALGLDANSPWTHWSQDYMIESPSGSHSYPTATSVFQVRSTALTRIRAIEKLWRDEGFVVEATQVDERRSLRATRTGGDDSFGLMHQANTILRVPEWLVSYMRDAIDRSERRKESINFARLVRRTMLPLNVLMTAKFLAEQDDGDQAIERSTEAAPALTRIPTDEQGKAEDDGEMAAEAE
ncbi:caspase family protein [Rhizobium sp. 1AS11]|uniref:caspase family protein n=1 Tax=Rhizobium acaciae TaxID=2989736 RepID=UPI002223D5D8|nr:caspase family protein [Rhizobium acaciae]MCW1408206.1 caspase family protein [Rhizobium acaciae]MCW1740357.1 caspase family protein [Rhizobium acaciae]